MSEHILAEIRNRIGFITLDRPKALNSLTLDMVRGVTQTLMAWRSDADIRAVLIRSSSDKAFCAGGDIRFFHDIGRATPQGGSALLEDFFSEEYALNHLIHHYPKPYIAVMDGVIMGGGMGIAQAGHESRMRIVTERTRMAMPEVNIGLFPDVGGSYFLSRAPGAIGVYLGVTGNTIDAQDALYAGLADVFVPSAQLPALLALLDSAGEPDPRAAIRTFAEPFALPAEASGNGLAVHRAAIDRHFSHDSVQHIVASLAQDGSPFAQSCLAALRKRSPLMMCVTLEQIRQGAHLSVGDCLRMERSMVRHCFEHGEVIEGIRALVVDKDNAPKWNPAALEDVKPEHVGAFFHSAWPSHAHPLRDLA